jgi:hypothetical protein
MDLLAAFRDANPRFFEEEFLAVYCDAHIGTQLLTGLRASNRAWRAAIPAPAHCKLAELIRKVARAGDIDACRAIHGRVRIDAFDAEAMLDGAACDGHENVCRLAHEYYATETLNMACRAAFAGHAHICKLAHEWDPDPRNLGFIAYEGARGGHMHICELAQSWCSRSLCGDIMRGSASGGQIHTFELALALNGANPVDWHAIMHRAVYEGRVDMCKFIREKGKITFDDNDYNCHGIAKSVEMCALARKWLDEDDDNHDELIHAMMKFAICNGHADVLQYLYDWATECDCTCEWQSILRIPRACDSMEAFRIACGWMLENNDTRDIDWYSLIRAAAQCDDRNALQILIDLQKTSTPRTYAPW